MSGTPANTAHTITGFLTAVPKNVAEFGPARSSRVATMVGSNGGYVEANAAMGAQGIWSIANLANIGLNLVDNSFLVSSLQPISSQGLANEDVLHRKWEPDNDDLLNTMETDLFMGYLANGKQHNIRLVNQIIMAPDVDLMVGKDPLDTLKGDIPNTSKLSTYDPDLKNALYIGKGGGAYIEGVLGVMDSLFTVDPDGISYFGSQAGAVDPGTGAAGNPTRSDKVFSVTDTNLQYGNIAGAGGTGAAADSLLTVSKISFEYGTTAHNPGTGAVPGAQLLFADKDKVMAGNAMLQVTSEDGEASKSTTWSTQPDAWSTVVGGGKAHKGAYTEYTYDANGVAVTDGIDKVTQDFALTVNGPAFVKDTLQVGKLKARDVDAAVLRGGADPATFDNARDDSDFYSVARTDNFTVGRSDPADATSYEKLKIVDEGNALLFPGTMMRHDSGVNITAGQNVENTLFRRDAAGVVTLDANPVNDMVRIGADNEVAISTIDSGLVSLQENILQAYRDDTRNTIDSVIDDYRIVNRDELRDVNYYHPNLTSANMVVGNVTSSVQTEAGEPVMYVRPELKADFISTGFQGGLEVYDYDNAVPANGAERTNPAIHVSKGKFEVRATRDQAGEGVALTDNPTFQVDNSSGDAAIPDAEKGGVYVRKGSINLDTDITANTGIAGTTKVRQTHDTIKAGYVDGKKAVGYVSADRFVANVQPTLAAVGATNASGSYDNVTAYDKFEVNPAYTSVMHDIKLTTRGGARLSDILPDFINKGIYVVDNTYSENTLWTNPGFSGNGTAVTGAETPTSAWLGFVPTPQCPPGYSKVITITPSGWAMAQAGTPSSEFMNKTLGDIKEHRNPYLYWYTDKTLATLRTNGDDTDAVQPLTFQKNTWLKAMIIPKCGSFDFTERLDICNANPKSFTGWSAIMGFIYPESYYKDVIDRGTGSSQDLGGGNKTVFWNLFPVYNKQLEAYATVYCYFYRDGFDKDFVDTDYDQLKKTRPFYDKRNATNKGRLNDPALKYNDPW